MATGVLHKLQSLISIVGWSHVAVNEGKVSRHVHECQVASWHLTVVHCLHAWLSHVLVGCCYIVSALKEESLISH